MNGPQAGRPAERRQLQQIIAGLTEGVIIIEPDRTVAWANEAALQLHDVDRLADLGGDVAAYRARFTLRHIDGSKLTASDYPMERLLAGESFGKLIVQVTAKGCDRHRVHQLRGLIIRDAEKQPDCYVLVVDDETERFNAEQRFERTFGANPAPAIIVRLSDMRHVKVNNGFLEMTGYRRDDLLGRSMHEIDLLQRAENRDVAIRRLHAGETIPQMEACLVLPHGGEKMVLLGGQPIEIGDQACMLFTFADLHARHEAQIALRESEERFSKAFHLAPGPMAILALEGLRVLDVNGAFTAATGWRREEVVGLGQSELEIWGQGETREKLEAELRRTGHLHSVDVRLASRLGSFSDYVMSAETVQIRQEHCVLCVMLDITERRQTETALLSAIDEVMADTSWLGQKIVEKLASLTRSPSHVGTTPEIASLPDRARQVLALVAQGLSDDEIATRLKIARNTVRNHVAVIYAKLGIRKRSAVIVWARERGLGVVAKPRTRKAKSVTRAKR